MTGEVIALALMAVGTGASAIGQIKQGNAAQRAGEFNAQVASNNAVASRASAKEDARRFARMARKQEGERIVSGASLDLLEDSAMEEELEALTILHAGEIQAIGFTATGALDQQEGVAARRKGRTGAMATALLGGAQIAETTAGSNLLKREP
jgi:hypothetical protein